MRSAGSSITIASRMAMRSTMEKKAMRNRLLNLFRLNAKKGAGILAEGNVIYLYDFIAGSEEEAQWWGGMSAEGFAKPLAGMEGPVSVRIDSPGGAVFGGRSIPPAIRHLSDALPFHNHG